MGGFIESPSREADLWIAFAGGDKSAREQLILLYHPLAARIAGKFFAGRAVDSVPYEDYLQFGLLGLIEALEVFDVSAGVKFSTFAGYRVRGAILNGLPRMTENGSQYEFYKRALEERNDSLIGDGKVAFEDFVDAIISLAVGFQLDALASGTGPREGLDPYSSLHYDQLLGSLSGLVKKLPLKQYMVVHGHYFQFKSFVDIAEELELSKGRISQIHREAIAMLRQLLRDRDHVRLA
ncbi:sigma-70 family RNA polymerase sigma factor [Microbulbifer sp. SAOS-129_SWC]|uniref:sigma-70 family RNA polymerase sigma factor n=1 Tax=Microbulbifer sp. SAOS-129_SWC TaxID=3145235 RepID=UPI0032163BE6